MSNGEFKIHSENISTENNIECNSIRGRQTRQASKTAKPVKTNAITPAQQDIK